MFTEFTEFTEFTVCTGTAVFFVFPFRTQFATQKSSCPDSQFLFESNGEEKDAFETVSF